MHQFAAAKTNLSPPMGATSYGHVTSDLTGELQCGKKNVGSISQKKNKTNSALLSI